MTKVGEISNRLTPARQQRGKRLGTPVWWTMRSTIMRPIAADMASQSAIENRRIELTRYASDPGHNPAA